MRIITTNMCSECCYCIPDFDNNAFCSKDMIYKPVKLNQSACNYFCDDSTTIEQYQNDNTLFDEEDYFEP